MNTKKEGHTSRLFTNDEITKKATGYYMLNGEAYINADEYQAGRRQITAGAVKPIIVGS